jgi:hypothetical protein
MALASGTLEQHLEPEAFRALQVQDDVEEVLRLRFPVGPSILI